MSFLLDWNRLLSEKRHTLVPVAEAPRDPSLGSQIMRTAFERDYDRVIFSGPFRRLARKTQVHPFAQVDHIHNRLTHSLEVASVGRSLAYAAGRTLVKRGQMPEGRTSEDLSCIVQSACLAHDIGNPPYGHAGEFAIREWTHAQLTDLFGNDIAGPFYGTARDWLFFEGNAQSFRMVSRVDNRDQCYFRFTYASLGAMIKYPWHSCDPRVDIERKFSIFSSEKGLFDDLVETLGLKRPDSQVVRHPLSFLCEAADDICYRIGDFEDAVQMRILQEEEVRQIFTKFIGTDAGRPLSAMRAQAISCLVEAAIETFEKFYEEIMSGERSWKRDLKSDFPPQMQEGLSQIKERYTYIFSNRPKVAVELGAYNTLGRMLAVYTRAVRHLTVKGNYEKLTFIEKRCLELAWGEKYVRDNQDKDYVWWLGRVMDFVSGMTDNYALQVSGEIGGS